MSETDSFIEEVTEEVRRDKLFALYRKYGWVAGLAVVLLVGGAAYNEWNKHRETVAAQEFGDKIMAALSENDVSKRADAIAKVPVDDPAAKPFLALLQAATMAENNDRNGAVKVLDAVAADEGAPALYRSLAELKAVILRGKDMDKTARMAALDKLATPGNPFRTMAMEEKALALVEYGDTAGAIKELQALLQEPGITQDLLDRAQRLIVALGGTLPDANPANVSKG